MKSLSFWWFLWLCWMWKDGVFASYKTPFALAGDFDAGDLLIANSWNESQLNVNVRWYASAWMVSNWKRLSWHLLSGLVYDNHLLHCNSIVIGELLMVMYCGVCLDSPKPSRGGIGVVTNGKLTSPILPGLWRLWLHCDSIVFVSVCV